MSYILFSLYLYNSIELIKISGLLMSVGLSEKSKSQIIQKNKYTNTILIMYYIVILN